jgi:NADH dehydrogenase/NADH:ubiquinone oxidoreductase subunit G
MFRRRSNASSTVTIYIDGAALSAASGDSVAAALLAHSAQPFRSTPVGGKPRLPYCMIGNCFDCLVEIDELPNRQACLITVREGMRVRRQQGPVKIKL